MSDKKEFCIAHVEPGKLNALVKNIMTQIGVKDPNEAVRLVNSGAYVVKSDDSRWREKDGIIYCSVISRMYFGSNLLMDHLEKNGHKIDNNAQRLILRPDYKKSPLNIVTEIAIIRGKLFSSLPYSKWSIDRIFARAKKLNFSTLPYHDTALLLRELLNQEDFLRMGIEYIYPMTKPFATEFPGISRLMENNLTIFDLHSNSKKERAIGVKFYDANLKNSFSMSEGFAFMVSQKILE